MTYFSIQVSAPTVIQNPPHSADNLKDALEDLFPHDTEDAYINWNGVRVPLNYKYDVSAIAARRSQPRDHIKRASG